MSFAPRPRPLAPPDPPPGAGADGAHELPLEDAFGIAYDELRQLAGGFLRRERPEHTLQPTALVHEAYIRLTEQRGVVWRSRGHFLAIAATMMRRILVNHAEAHRAAKRGGGVACVTLDTSALWAAEAAEPAIDVLALDEALTALAVLDARAARVVELRFFAGLTVEETAGALGISPATVKREWTVARTWLRREIGRLT
jgi:RNA polymerase sigma-70 factor (ECF subfamily)